MTIAAMILALTGSGFAQTSKGYFVGNVSDQTGAVVSGAVVRITNASTRVTHVSVSTDDGSFHFDAIDPGTYRIEITQPGFKTITRDGLITSPAQNTTANFVLEVGTHTEMVVVRRTSARVWFRPPVSLIAMAIRYVF
jgi:carboxypeptidase family protein